MIVVDASALAAFILKEEGWEELARYLRRCVSVDHVVKEVANAIWRAFYLRKRMSLDEARYALRLLLKLVERSVEIYPEIRYLEKAFAISVEHGITVYDALYIALAKDRNLPLLTLDEKQRCIAKTLGIAVLP